MNDNAQQSTYWPGIWAAFVAGCIGAAHIGKVSAALVTIIADLGLTLFEGGLIISLFSFVGALVGAGFGLLADRVGHLRIAVGGLAMCGIGSLLGAQAGDFGTLLATRLLEGFGFILSIVALPSLISAAAADRDRPQALGLWGAFMPAGIGLSLLLSPLLLERHGWRGAWGDFGLLALAWCGVLWFAFRGRDAGGGAHVRAGSALQSLRNPGPWLVFAAFVCYSSLFVPLTSFFPTLLVSEFDTPLALASRLAALVVLGNVIGNIGGGWLIGRGVGPSRVLMFAFAGMGTCALLVYDSATAPWLKTVAGCLFTTVGGLVPSTAFALAARFALRPTHMALMAGLMLQGASIGQTLGPAVVSALVEAAGEWDVARLPVVVFGLLGLAFGWRLRRLRGA